MQPKKQLKVQYIGIFEEIAFLLTKIVSDDDNDGFNDNYDDNFDDNYDKNDKKTYNYFEV